MRETASAKAMTRIVCACVLLILAAGTASANICLLKEVSVSHIRGQANVRDEAFPGFPVQVWSSTSRGDKVSLVAEGETDAAGNFSFSNISSGWYRLTLPVTGFHGDDFLIHLQGRNIMRWRPSNWLQVGIGLPSMRCPDTYIKATRKSPPAAKPTN